MHPPDQTQGPTAPLRRRLRVLHVVVPTSGGVADVTLGYLRDQVERGWNVTLACPSEGPLGFAAREAGVRVHWWRAARHTRLGTIGEMSRLDDILDRVNPDVVHLHGGKAGLAGRLLIRDRIPTVYQPHAWSFLTSTGASRLVALRWERVAVRWTGELVCMSDTERRVGAAAGVVAPTTVLRPGVDVALLRPQEGRERTAARQELSLPDAPTAVALGPIRDADGVRELREIWAGVRAEMPQARLLVVGDDGAAERVEVSEGVTLVGGRVDLECWLAAADVVVSPPAWTGTSLAPLQAMACARSVVMADSTGLAEGVLPPDAGAVVAADATGAFAEAVLHRLRWSGEAEDEGWAGRSHVEFHHDLATSARELSRVYLRLVGTRRGR